MFCNKIWRRVEWQTLWTQLLIITLPKLGNLELCLNYRTICLISHSSTVMLKVIFNRLKPQAEEQVGARSTTTEHTNTFNLWILCEKYIHFHPKQSLYHVFIYFRKALDRVYGPPCGSTISMQFLYAPLSTSVKRLQVQFRHMLFYLVFFFGNVNGSQIMGIYPCCINFETIVAPWENGSEQQLELGKDDFFSPTLINIFLKRIVLMPWKNINI